MEAHCFPHEAPLVVSCSKSDCKCESLSAPLILLLYIGVPTAVYTQTELPQWRSYSIVGRREESQIWKKDRGGGRTCTVHRAYILIVARKKGPPKEFLQEQCFPAPPLFFDTPKEGTSFLTSSAA